MSHSTARLAPCLFALLACAGCDPARNAFRPVEERVGDAFPVASAVADTRIDVQQLIGTDAELAAAFDREYAAKLRLRALTCAPGVKPGIFESAVEIRARVAEPQCFDAYDAALARELHLRRVGMLLAAGPLRPIAAELPARIAAANDIVLADFARDAGVALVTSSRALEIVDLGADKSILLDPDPRPFVMRATLSPNGRVFAVTSQTAGSEGVRLRASDTGEVLVELPNVNMFEWLDATTAWITTKDIRGSELFEVATGKKYPMRGIASVPTQMLRVPGRDSVFVARSGASLTQFELSYVEGEPQITVLGTQVTPSLNWTAGISTTTVDAKFFVQGGQKVAISDLTTLRTQELSIEPHSIRGTSPLPNPNELLVSVFIPSWGASTQKYFVMNVLDSTFAPVEDERFNTSPGLSASRTYYVPSANRVVLVSGATISPLGDFRRGFRLGLQPFKQHLAEQDEAFRTTAVRSADGRAPAPRALDLPPSATGNVAELAQDAQIEAIGVYESAGAPRSRPGQPSGRGPVHVLVRRAPKPIVLVLSSYDPVDWDIRIEPGAQLKAVLLGGYEESTVKGTGTLRPLRIGRVYAYEQGSEQMAALQREVVRWTGRPIDTFQGTYKGGSFTVGGR